MKKMQKKILTHITKHFAHICFVMLLAIFFLPCFAAEDLYHFDTTVKQQRFAELTNQLRCLVCQNQNLAESNAPLANDLRDIVYEQIQKGKTDPEIVNYLVSRYGNFILYKPPLKMTTLGLWLGPFLFLFGGMGYLLFYLRKAKS